MTDSKLEYAQYLLGLGIPYREIQDILKDKFGEGMSNSTLRKLKAEHEEQLECHKELAQVKKELELYKNLYYDLKNKIKEKLGDL